MAGANRYDFDGPQHLPANLQEALLQLNVSLAQQVVFYGLSLVQSAQQQQQQPPY